MALIYSDHRLHVIKSLTFPPITVTEQVGAIWAQTSTSISKHFYQVIRFSPISEFTSYIINRRSDALQRGVSSAESTLGNAL